MVLFLDELGKLGQTIPTIYPARQDGAHLCVHPTPMVDANNFLSHIGSQQRGNNKGTPTTTPPDTSTGFDNIHGWIRPQWTHWGSNILYTHPKPETQRENMLEHLIHTMSMQQN